MKRAPKHNPFRGHVKRYIAPEPSRQARRAFATNSATWRKIRAAKLARNPLCECCERGGCPKCAKSGIRPANQVDHIDGDASNNDDDNHQSLCAWCHSYKTSTENGGFGNNRAPAAGHRPAADHDRAADPSGRRTDAGNRRPRGRGG